MATKVALLLGSLRRPGNGIRIATWLTPVLRQAFNDTGNGAAPHQPNVDVVFMDSTNPPLPLGPIVDGSHVPSDIRDPSQHPNPAVREFATFVSSCSGFVVLSPEYNGTYSGELKNTFDHLYWEWRKKPVSIITYGGGGGGRCATQLRTLLADRFKMRVAEKNVEIKLPRSRDGHTPDWLEEYRPEILQTVEELKQLIEDKS
ncbi:flavoprotein [Cubamyces menziesii]|uniref:NADPH-dependent FMN reductase-like domain-containing protein n=1 Tax=Trametes cubensis TaxID=1111947 RepID=A0AAD7U2B2_9APHY|nr:flavoprotein [Cubamyces menziesii]KAJ8495619.1 hypothetical protein ONZ51_g1613 [Trametes cubensis]